MLPFEADVEGPVVEPGGTALRVGEAVELRRELGEAARREALPGQAKELFLAGDCGSVVDARRRQPFPGCEGLGREEAVRNQGFGRDQQGVAGEGGERVVGGIAQAGRAEGQDLPDRETGRDHPVEHGDRRRSEVADRKLAGKARRVQEQAGGARAARGGSGLSLAAHSRSR